MPGKGDVGSPRAISGAEDRAFEELFGRHEREIGLFLAQMTRDRDLADDLLQETFLAAFRDREACPSRLDEERAWLFTVARHRALHALRGLRRQRELLDRVARTLAVRPALPGDEPDFLRDVLVEVLSPKDRSLLLCRYVFGFSAEELSQVTGQTPAAVRQRLTRARARVAVRIAKSDAAALPVGKEATGRED